MTTKSLHIFDPLDGPSCRKDHVDFIRDIAPVAGIIRTPGVMEVNPSFPAKTVPEFIAYAKANPGNR
jgi:tripartite-type tricarboxylate transporter receptor subunit TctC